MELEKEQKRSARIIMTNEARVLRDLRIQHGFTMRKAGELLGLSDSYISHIETGRIDVPKGEKLERVLSIYGGIRAKSFYERARNYSEKFTTKDELMDLINRASDTQINTVLAIVKSLIS